jgi:hypothetical protein
MQLFEEKLQIFHVKKNNLIFVICETNLALSKKTYTLSKSCMAGPLVIKEWQFQLSSDGLQFYQYEQKRTSTSYLHKWQGQIFKIVYIFQIMISISMKFGDKNLTKTKEFLKFKSHQFCN